MSKLEGTVRRVQDRALLVRALYAHLDRLESFQATTALASSTEQA